MRVTAGADRPHCLAGAADKQAELQCGLLPAVLSFTMSHQPDGVHRRIISRRSRLHLREAFVEGMRSPPSPGRSDWSLPACSLIMYSELDTFPDNISGSCIAFIQQVGLADLAPCLA